MKIFKEFPLIKILQAVGLGMNLVQEFPLTKILQTIGSRLNLAHRCIILSMYYIKFFKKLFASI